MKKRTIGLIAILLCLCGVTVLADDDFGLEIEETFSELSPKFTYELGKCLKDDTRAMYSLLMRGDEVSITDENEDYYFIDDNGLMLAVEKIYIRTENEKDFISYKGYTRKGSAFYSDIAMEDAIALFGLNDEVKVLDRFAGVLLVEYEGKQGYMYPSQVSEKEIKVTSIPKAQEPAAETYSSGGSSSSPSAPSAPSGDSAPSSPPQEVPSSGDGEDITLALQGSAYTTFMLAYSNAVKGKVLADNTEIYIAFLNRGDEIKVLEREEIYSFILLNGRKGRIENAYIRMDDEKGYEVWSGYAKSGAVIFSNFALSDRLKKCSLNDEIQVVDEVDGVYVVELENGEIGYMDSNAVSRDKNKASTAPAAPAAEEPAYVPSSGGNSDAAPSAPATPSDPPAETTPEWTEPVL